jgi:hypothetical protein
MDSEEKNITKTEDELEMEIRHKLFDALIEDYENYKIDDSRTMVKISSGEELVGCSMRFTGCRISGGPDLNRHAFLFGCTGNIFISYPERAWFFYFLDKLVLMIKCSRPPYGEYFRVFEYGSIMLSYISIYDISKIVFKHLTEGPPYFNCRETNEKLELDLDLDVDKLIYGYGNGNGQGMNKWFMLSQFQFQHHINNGYITDTLPNFTGRGDMRSIIMTIRSHIRKMIEKNEQNRIKVEFNSLKEDDNQEIEKWVENEFENIDSQFEKQSKIISLQESQISDMNEIISRMQSQMEQQTKIISEQQSKIDGMKKIMTNMLREQQSMKSIIETMQRKIEEQSKILEYNNKTIDNKKSLEHSTLDSDIEKILNGEM